MKKAEAGLAAEIVPCVFAQSSPYPESIWAGAGVGMSLAVAVLFLADVYAPPWQPLARQILWVPAAGLAGALLGRWFAPLKRGLIGGTRMKAAVERRAKEVFFDHGVARAATRRGVLIFASLLERRVVVLADEGVRGKIPDSKWDEAAAAMTTLAAKGDVPGGLCAAIASVSATLKAAGFSGGASDANELGDDPLTGHGR
ncbi:MAG: TPM domain-containing protein [Elusimicrobiota bacterium]|nr:MAG: TPM domain-containing protein [Elusimicrobiota bacterium]